VHICIDGGHRYDIGPRVYRESNDDMKGSRRPVDDRMARDVQMTTPWPSSRHRDSLLAISVRYRYGTVRYRTVCSVMVMERATLLPTALQVSYGTVRYAKP